MKSTWSARDIPDQRGKTVIAPCRRSTTRRVGALLVAFAFLTLGDCDRVSWGAPLVASTARKGSPMKIRLTIDGSVLTATLTDNAAARDFVAMLPLSLTLRDYAGTEKVSDLPSRLSVTGTPAGIDPDVGDITYYAPWGNLAIFYRDFGYADGLVALGHLDAGIAELAKRRGPFKVRLERIAD